jgi:DNA repair exonuclease SbcCD ATPase subunit
MISLDTIWIQNFLSVGAVRQKISLNAAPLTLLLGINLDIGVDNSRNGAGKSTLLQAICYALYGEPLTKIKVDNLINAINQQELYVCLDFCRDGVPYRIERGRKPNKLRFLVGEERKDVSKGTNDQTQIEIERIIGMTHMMFLHVVALNTFTLPFLKMRPADQRDVIEELMGITQISILAEHLKQQIDVSKETLRNEEATIKAGNATNERIMAVVEQTQVQAHKWQQSHEELLSQLNQQLQDSLLVDIDSELRLLEQIESWNAAYVSRQTQISSVQAYIDTATQNFTRLQRDISRYELAAETGETDEVRRLREKIAALERELLLDDAAEIARLQNQINRHQTQIAVGRQQLDQIEQNLLDVMSQQERPDQHQCSTCGQALAGTDHLAHVMEALESKRIGLIGDYGRVQVDINMHEDHIAAIQREIDALRLRRAQTRRDITAHIATLTGNIDDILVTNEALRQESYQQALRLKSDIALYESEIKGYQTTLTRLMNQSELGDRPTSVWQNRNQLYEIRQQREKLIARIEIETDKANPFQEKVASLLSTLLTLDYDAVNLITDQLKHEQFLYKLLTSKDSFIRKRIIDQNLRYLNNSLNRFLELLGLPHEVNFLPDLTVDITLSGRDYDFDQLSRGEMNRVILATSWAFRKLWENLNTDLNLLLLDEVLDQGTDEAGVEAAVEFLTNMANEQQKNILLISHRESLRSRIDRVLIAQKCDSFTIFSEETG